MNFNFKIPDHYYYSRQADKSLLLHINLDEDSEKTILVSGLLKEILDFTFTENNREIDEEKIRQYLLSKYAFDEESFKVFFQNVLKVFNINE